MRIKVITGPVVNSIGRLHVVDADTGETVENMVALCEACHKQAHKGK